MAEQIYIIARYTFLEAVRNRLFVLLVTGQLCIFGLTEFTGELAITETKQIQAALTGTALRLFTVCIISLFVVTSMIREVNDKGFEQLLSLSITRSSYYLGKGAGFLCLAVIVSLAAALILCFYCEPLDVFVWFVSLLCECLLIIPLCLLCLFTFSGITTAFTAVIAFYLLSRSMNVIQLISESPILESMSFSQSFINFVLDIIAYLTPDLELYTRSEWLLYGAEPAVLVPVVIQTVIYTLVLVAAGLFDLYRKEF